jgi:hypothetical protein
MKAEREALIFSLALGALLPACVGMGEKPADSAPPIAATPAATAPAPVAVASAANPVDPDSAPPASTQSSPQKPAGITSGATGRTP